MRAVQLDPKVLDVVTRFLRDLDSPISKQALTLVETGKWDQLVELKFNPANYSFHDWRLAKRDYQAVNLLRKAKFLPIKRDLESEARETWFKAERQCFDTNRRLSHLLPPVSNDPWAVQATMVVARIRKVIRSILGRVPDQIEPMFGPGSVFESAGVVDPSELVLLDKLDRIQPAVTPEAAGIFYHYYSRSKWMLCTDRWSQAVPTLANRFATVPKSATSLRAIAVEPGGNLWLQKGIGKAIRRRLQRSAGLLREEGKSERHHHWLAQRGSLTGEYATIDLSNASDTISSAVVRLLLPDDWYALLDACRVKFTLIDGKRVYLEKFSSMGNGFTFELETLIFYAIAKTVCEDSKVDGVVSAYGDDIVVPTGAAVELIAALRFFGFTPNDRKTFVQGYFRESCGGDYFAGVDITSVKIEDTPVCPEDWIAICNKLHARWDREDPTDPAHRAWKVAHAQIPKALRRCQSTPEYGDSAIHWNEPRLVYDRGLQNFVPLLVTREPIRIPMDRHSPNAILSYALLGGDSRGPSPRQRSVSPVRVKPPTGAGSAVNWSTLPKEFYCPGWWWTLPQRLTVVGG